MINLNDLIKNIRNRFARIKASERAYYKGDPLMVDAHYDIELEALHQKYEEYLRLNGGIDNLKLDITPATEVEKVRTFEELEEWADDNFEGLENKQDYLYLEPKYDGINLTLVYRHGEIKQALMRGNRGKRKDILPLLAGNKTIPLKTKLVGGDVDIQGELLFPRSVVKLISENYGKGKTYSTARSALVAIINSKSAQPLQKHAVFKPYKHTSSDGIVKLEANYTSWGFQPQIAHKTRAFVLVQIFESIIKGEKNFHDFVNGADDFDLDGLVLTYNLRVRSNAKFNQVIEPPHIALKPRKPVVRVTQIKTIEKRMNVRGITYILIVDPIRVGDKLYSRIPIREEHLVENEEIREKDHVQILIQNDKANFMKVVQE